jgi:hypothetical protein
MHICIFGLPTIILGILELLLYRWKGLEKYVSTVYYMPPYDFFGNFSRKIENKNM